MSNSRRRCTNCKKYSLATDGIVCPVGFFCDNECRIEYGIKKTDKLRAKHKQIVDKKFNKKKREFKLNDKPYRTTEAQAAFNSYIRYRDSKEPCISCQRYHDGQYHAGHFKTTKARPDLRFNVDNCHKQCAPCNNNLSGNIGEYITHLINKIGQQRFDELTRVNIKKYTCEELKDIEIYYKTKLKELK